MTSPAMLRQGRRVLGRAHGAAVVVANTFGSGARARAFKSEPPAWLRLTPESLRHMLRLDPPPPGDRRVEIGSGFAPTPGFIHVDVTPKAAGLDLLARGDRLPLADGWADEMLSVHMIEHVPPPMVVPTLRDWNRVLRSGATVTIHTPNAESLGRALTDAVGDGSGGSFWAAQSAIFGYGHHPRDCHGPTDLVGLPDHTVLFTFPVLAALLREAGFENVENVSGQDPCRHFVEWSPFVSDLCLEVSARKVSDGAGGP